MTTNENLMNGPVATESNRLNGLLIILVIALPMVIAYLMYHTGLGIPTSTSNKGILLSPPQPITDLELHNDDQSLAQLYSSGNKKWRLLVPIAANCGDICQNNLYITRQVHIRLAEKAYRVERILLSLVPLAPDARADLIQEHPGVRILESNTENLAEWLSQLEAPENYYYLVDQGGYAMMRYGKEHTGQHLLDDVKKVLKYTYEK